MELQNAQFMEQLAQQVSQFDQTLGFQMQQAADQAKARAQELAQTRELAMAQLGQQRYLSTQELDTRRMLEQMLEQGRMERFAGGVTAEERAAETQWNRRMQELEALGKTMWTGDPSGLSELMTAIFGEEKKPAKTAAAGSGGTVTWPGGGAVLVNPEFVVPLE
jgi:hypothetical protein